MQYKVGRTLAKSNYTETDLANFRKTASMYGVNVMTFSDKQDLDFSKWYSVWASYLMLTDDFEKR